MGLYQLREFHAVFPPLLPGGWSSARAYDVSPQGPNTNDPFFIVEATKEEGGDVSLTLT